MGLGAGGGGPGGAGPGASGMPMPGSGGGRRNMGPGAATGGMGPNQGDMGRMMQMRGQMAQAGRPGGAGNGGSGMPPGMQGMAGRRGEPGGPGNAAGDNTPANYHNPRGAVQAFLNALKAKDPERIYEACALRAPREASERMKPTFQKISDLSLSDSEIDELAEKLDGYQIVGENPARSTGRVGVVLQRSPTRGNNNNNTGMATIDNLVVTVRKEKKGYGVVDIGLHSGSRRTGSR